MSEPETRMIADFAFDHPNIAIVFSFTPEDNLMHPWKSDSSNDGKRIPTKVLSDDAPYFDFLATRYQEIRTGKDAPPSPTGAGSFSEWAYFHYGRWSFAARGWWPPKVEVKPDEERAPDVDKASAEDPPDDDSQSTLPTNPQAEDSVPAKKNAAPKAAKMIGAPSKWPRSVGWTSAGIDGFVPWTAIEHPDFPDKKVEVGGFKPFYRLNPPAESSTNSPTSICLFCMNLPD